MNQMRLALRMQDALTSVQQWVRSSANSKASLYRHRLTNIFVSQDPEKGEL